MDGLRRGEGRVKERERRVENENSVRERWKERAFSLTLSFLHISRDVIKMKYVYTLIMCFKYVCHLT